MKVSDENFWLNYKTLGKSVPSGAPVSDLLVLLLLPPSQSWIIEPPQKFPL